MLQLDPRCLLLLQPSLWRTLWSLQSTQPKPESVVPTESVNGTTYGGARSLAQPIFATAAFAMADTVAPASHTKVC